MPGPDRIARRSFEKGTLWWARAGVKFGDSRHVDATCEGQISVQYKGTKKWRLFSPDWSLPLHDGSVLHPATCFETKLEEGEVLFWAPGWYHQTAAGDEELSIAIAYYTTDPCVACPACNYT